MTVSLTLAVKRDITSFLLHSLLWDLKMSMARRGRAPRSRIVRMRQRLHESQAKASEEAETTKERLQEVEQSLQQLIARDTAMIEQLRADAEQLETHCRWLEAQINHLITEADAAQSSPFSRYSTMGATFVTGLIFDD